MTIYSSSDHGFNTALRDPPRVRFGILVRRGASSVYLGPPISWHRDEHGALVAFDSLEEARREANLLKAEEQAPSVQYEGARIGAV